MRKNLWNYIRDLNSKGTTICLTTHYLEEAEKLCEFITIINNGKIIKSDTKKNLLELIGNKIVTFEIENLNSLPSKLSPFNPIINNNKLMLTYDKNKFKISDIIKILNENKITFNEISTKESDLEDVFVKLTNLNNE